MITKRHFWKTVVAAAAFALVAISAPTLMYADELTDAENAASDFVIEDGVLVSYTGTDSEVVIPDGVTAIGDNAFAWNENICSIVIPEGVTSIGEFSFRNCYKLEKIAIPNTVTVIGEGAFFWCTSLESVTISNQVTSLPDLLFLKCTNLSNIEIPEGVTAIGDSTFHSCEKLERIVLPSTVVNVGNYAFAWCESLKEATLPDSLSEIPNSMFMHCMNLSEVNIPDNISSIGWGAFYGCEKIEKFEIPDTVTFIDREAFGWCTSLESIVIPNQVTSLEDQLFWGCTNLSNIEIPESITHIGRDVFGMTAWLTNQQAKNPLVVVNGYLVDGSACVNTVKIPADVKQICDGAFYWNLDITKVVIEEGVEKIGDEAFGDCINLTEIVIPESVTEISEYAFIQWVDKEEYEPLDAKLFVVENSYAHTYAIKNGFTYGFFTEDDLEDEDFVIENGVLVSYTGTDSEVVIPDGVTAIGDSAFAGNKNVCSIIIPEGVISIGDDAFMDCEKLEKITIPNTVTSIGWGAFFWCTSLEDVVIPDKVTSWEDYLFAGCTKLSNIKIPESVTDFGFSVFYKTAWLAEQQAKNPLVVVNGCVVDGSACKNTVTIPANVKKVCDGAFYGNTDIIKVVIEEGAEKIGEAFSDCTNLTEVIIPESVTEISEYAFIQWIGEDLYENSNVKLVVVENSYAHTFAVENKYTYEFLTEGGNTEAGSNESEVVIKLPEVTEDTMESIIAENKDKAVVIESTNGVEFTFPAGSMSAVDGVTKYDFTVEIVNKAEENELKGAPFEKEAFVLRINYNYSGKLPGEAQITIPVGVEYAGKTLYYYLVKEDGTLEYTGKHAVVDSEGNYTISQDHCSDYVIATAAPIISEKGDNSTLAYVLVSMIGIAVIATVGKRRMAA